MLQINDKVYQLACGAGLSKNTLILFFELVMACDARGCVEFNCVDLAKSTGLSHMSVYRGLKKLEGLKVLRVSKIHAGKHVEILGNNYENGDMKKFINMNIRFFTERCYKELTSSEITTFLFYYRLYLMRKEKAAAKIIKIEPGMGPLCKAISLYTGVSEVIARESIKELTEKGFFEKIELDEAEKMWCDYKHKYSIRIKKYYIEKARHKSKNRGNNKNDYLHIATMHNIAAVRFECHKLKMDIDPETAFDCGEVANLYYKNSKKLGKNIYVLMRKALIRIKMMKNVVFTGALFNRILRNTAQAMGWWQLA